MLPEGITTYTMGATGLVLVHDENADCFDNGWAVLAGAAPDTDDYADFWSEADVIAVNRRVLAWVVTEVTGIPISL